MTAYRYRALTVDEKHDMLASTLLSQERDLFVHTINLERYEAILERCDRTSTFGHRMLELLKDTRERKKEVLLILEALSAQLPTSEALEAALERIAMPKEHLALRSEIETVIERIKARKPLC